MKQKLKIAMTGIKAIPVITCGIRGIPATTNLLPLSLSLRFIPYCLPTINQHEIHKALHDVVPLNASKLLLTAQPLKARAYFSGSHGFLE